MKFCYNCGNKLVEGDKFCRECGSPLEGMNKFKMIDGPGAYPPVSGPGSSPVNSFLGMGMMGMMGGSSSGRYFSYSTNGMMYRSGFDIRITENNGKLTAMYRKPFVDQQFAKQFEVDDAFFAKITQIIDKYKGDSWDGFNEHAQGVFDGDSFTFSFKDGKGRSINAGGYMAWPEGLRAAMSEIVPLYDEIYETLFPALNKALEKYIDDNVVAKYGDSYKDSMTRGSLITRIPYIYTRPGMMAQGENPMPEGVIGSLVTQGYDGKNMDYPGYRAVVVLVDKADSDEKYWNKDTNIKLQYYGIERGEEVRFIEEVPVLKEAVQGNGGTFSMFNFGSLDETTIGIFNSREWGGGDNKETIYFSAFRLEKNGMKHIGEISADIPRETGKMSEEDMRAVCKLADDSGLAFISVGWRNEWARAGKISLPLVSSFVNYHWSSVMNGEGADEPGDETAGTPVRGKYIQVFRM